MSELANNTRTTIMPGLRYRDAPAAIEFLCAAFGFDRHLVVPGEDDRIAHAQLTFGNGMIMLGSHPHDGPYGEWVQPPHGKNGVNTMGLYVVVTDVDTHYWRAKRGGARILMEPSDKPYGGRDYTCRDIEGHVWNFGTYDPWMPAP